MRARWAVGAGIVVLAALGAWVLWPTPGAVQPAVDTPRAIAPSPPPPAPERLRTGARQLSGRVLTAEGLPVPEADVDVVFDTTGVVPTHCAALVEGCTCGAELEAGLLELDRAFAPLQQTQTDADGRFALKDLPEGVGLRLRTSDDNFYATALVPDAEATVVLKLALELAPSAFITDEERQPLAGSALLAVEAGKVIAFARPDKEGLTTVIAPPTVHLFAFAPGHARASRFVGSQMSRRLPNGGSHLAVRVIELTPGKLFSGRLVGGDGKPIPNTAVKATTESDRQGDDTFEVPTCAAATTDVEGNYTLGPLPGGSFSVEARSGTRRMKFKLSTYARSGAPDASIPSHLLDDAVVRGTVLGADGQPMEGAQLRVTRFPIGGGDGSSLEPKLDERGKFEVHDVPGQFRLGATAPGHLEASADKVLGEKETWEVNLSLEKTSGISGIVEDTTGRPVAHVSVSLQYKTDNGRTTRATGAISGADGTFSGEVLPGDVELQAQGNGYLTTRLKAHAPQAGIRIVVNRGAALEGRVIDEKGEPVPKIPVTLTALEGQEGSQAVSGADGKFRVEGLGEGRFDAIANDQKTELNRPPSGTPGTVTSKLLRTAHAVVEVRGALGPFLELRLVGISPVHGRVVDEQGTGLPGITVRAGRPAGAVVHGEASFQILNTIQRMTQSQSRFSLTGMASNQAVSGPDGSFTLEGIAPNQQLFATAPGLGDDPSAPTVVNPGDDAVVLKLIRPHFLTAEVTSSKGLPISSVTLDGFVVPSPGGHLSFEVRFAFSGRLFIGADGHLPAPRTVALSPRSDLALGTITLITGRTITAHVTDLATGAPTQAWFSLGDAYLRSQDNGGEISLTVPNAAVTLRVSGPDHVETTVAVGADQTAISVSLDPGSTVSGLVLDRGGNVVRAWGTTLLVEGCPKKNWGSTLADGSFSITGIGPGQCQLSAQVANGDRGPVKTITVPPRGQVSVNVVAPAPR